MPQPREGVGTHQTLLKEATNQQNAICQVVLLLASLSSTMLPTGHLCCSSRTWTPNISSSWLWYILLYRWSMTSALLLGLPSVAWLFAHCFSGIDSLPCLQALVWVWLHSSQVFPVLWWRKIQRRWMTCLEAQSQWVAWQRFTPRWSKKPPRALRSGVGPKEGEGCRRETEGGGPRPYSLRACKNHFWVCGHKVWL